MLRIVVDSVVNSDVIVANAVVVVVLVALLEVPRRIKVVTFPGIHNTAQTIKACTTKTVVLLSTWCPELISGCLNQGLWYQGLCKELLSMFSLRVKSLKEIVFSPK
jgi:hypothetical protein